MLTTRLWVIAGLGLRARHAAVACGLLKREVFFALSASNEHTRDDGNVQQDPSDAGQVDRLVAVAQAVHAAAFQRPLQGGIRVESWSLLCPRFEAGLRNNLIIVRLYV